MVPMMAVASAIMWPFAISSVAGFAPLHNRTAYAASKHAMEGFFNSLRSEEAPYGVAVQIAAPSFIATNLGEPGTDTQGISRPGAAADGGPARHRAAGGRAARRRSCADRSARGRVAVVTADQDDGG